MADSQEYNSEVVSNGLFHSVTKITIHRFNASSTEDLGNSTNQNILCLIQGTDSFPHSQTISMQPDNVDLRYFKL